MEAPPYPYTLNEHGAANSGTEDRKENAMPWGWIGWIIIGGLAGWVASILTKNDARMGILSNIVVGIIGAIAGGWILSLLGFTSGAGLIGSFLTALLGATLLLWVTGLILKGK